MQIDALTFCIRFVLIIRHMFQFTSSFLNTMRDHFIEEGENYRRFREPYG